MKPYKVTWFKKDKGRQSKKFKLSYSTKMSLGSNIRLKLLRKMAPQKVQIKRNRWSKEEEEVETISRNIISNLKIGTLSRKDVDQEVGELENRKILLLWIKNLTNSKYKQP